jgi:CRP/FNR family cyclic AMP-dependent transcriptional regulator
MPGKNDQLDHLAQVPLFAELSRRDLQKVAKASDEVTVETGRVLVREGELGHEFFLIMTGSCTVRRGNRKVATLGPGQWFGEMAVLSKAARNATVVADEPSTLLVLGQREFFGVLEDVPNLSTKLLRTLATRLRDADTRNVGH